MEPSDTTSPSDTVEPSDTTPPADTTGPTDTSEPPDTGGCPLYHRLCDGVCVNTNADPDNCGECGHTCDAGQACSAGGCSSTCLGNLVACDGTCVDTRTHPDYCGDCFTKCPEGQGCADSHCVPSVTVGDPPADCAEFGPLVVDLDGEETCLDVTAETNFTWALCSCDGIDLSNEVLTDAYDSRFGPYVPGGLGGGVGTGGAFDASNKLTINGTFWAAAEMSLSNDVVVAGELRAGAGLFAALLDVALDAWVGGNVSTGSTITIDGTLHVPSTATITGNVIAGATVQEPVSVGQPCRCAPEQLVPVADLVSHFAADNDNAYVGLDPGVLNWPGAAVHLTLPCGTYYLDNIASSHAITIVATGRTALFVGGDIAGSGNIQIVPSPEAELDVFVAGTLDTSSKLTLGSPNFPALLRIYFGTDQQISVSNSVEIGGFLWAGYGSFRASNKIEIFGGIFTGAFDASNKIDIHYDRAILDVGVECEPPEGTGCDSCEDCGNQACVDGECGACVTTDDCCAPLLCIEGQCLSLGIGTD
ncbi:MAG: hypothetical protein EP329_26805 [Deltaproteobacteria bacterium]|nr:MAG: hypothetical protein EP329_26805 [Deltaproteobacteria bacterium]